MPIEGESDVVLDNGSNQHSRRLNNRLQHPPAHGKISTPGNSPFSLPGSPRHGTAREVGTSHRLPADMVVTNPKHREKAGRSGSCPRHDRPKPGYHAVQQNRMLRNAKPTSTGCRSTTNAGRAQHDAGGLPGSAIENFIVVSGAYPRHRAGRGPHPPTAMWVEKEAPTATPSSHALLAPAREGAGRIAPDLWRLAFSKRFKMEEVWPADLLAKKPSTP
jgi:nitrate reductase NapA